MAEKSSLQAAFPDISNLSLKEEATLAKCRDGIQETWDLGIRRGIFDIELQAWIELEEKLEGFHLGEREDNISWYLNSLGAFSTKSLVFNLATSRQLFKGTLTKLIWDFKNSRKMKFFSWSMAHRSLNAQERIQRK